MFRKLKEKRKIKEQERIDSILSTPSVSSLAVVYPCGERYATVCLNCMVAFTPESDIKICQECGLHTTRIRAFNICKKCHLQQLNYHKFCKQCGEIMKKPDYNIDIGYRRSFFSNRVKIKLNDKVDNND